MGQIIAVYDMMPESTEIDLEAAVKKVADVIPKGVEVIESKIEPVAFGLKKITIGFSIDDSDETIGEELEKALMSIPGIENIESVSSTLL